MIPEGRDRGFVDVGSCEVDAVEEPTDTLGLVDGNAHQHQNENPSNLDIRVHHHDLSQHPHHSLDDNSDPTTALFPHQQHLQTHRHDLNGMPSSTDTNHISTSDLLQQHLLTHNTLAALNPHLHQPSLQHSEQQNHHQYQQQQQLQQQEHHLHNLNHQTQQHPFSYHHERHSSGDDENDTIDEATTALQHDVSVVDVGGLHQHPHPTDINPISEHHQNHRIIHQEHEHQISLEMVYHPHQYTQQYQQETQQLQQQQQHQIREQEDPSSSVDPTQSSLGMASTMFPPQNSPLTLPTRAYPQMKNPKSSMSSAKIKKASRSDKKGGVNASKVADKKRKQQGSIINDETSIETGSLVPGKKPRRRRYENNFKAEVLNHLKGPHTKLSDVARRYGIPENTLREWTKADVVHAIETARSKNSGQLKANMYDPMKRLTETLVVFFEHNGRQPEHLRQSITTKLIVAKGLEARNTLLQRHATHPFLEPKEKRALENFSGSDSWAKKFAKRRDLKMTGARIKELSEEDINQFHQSLKQMSNRVRQAGPAYEESARLIRQAAQKLLLASIIHSTSSHRLMGNIAVNNSRSDRKKHRSDRKIHRAPRSTSQIQQSHREQQMDDETSKLQPDHQLVHSHVLRDALNLSLPTPDQHPLSP